MSCATTSSRGGNQHHYEGDDDFVCLGDVTARFRPDVTESDASAVEPQHTGDYDSLASLLEDDAPPATDGPEGRRVATDEYDFGDFVRVPTANPTEQAVARIDASAVGGAEDGQPSTVLEEVTLDDLMVPARILNTMKAAQSMRLTIPRVRVSSMLPTDRAEKWESHPCRLFVTATDLIFLDGTVTHGIKPSAPSPSQPSIQACFRREIHGGLLFINGFCCVPRASLREVQPFGRPLAAVTTQNPTPFGLALRTRDFQQIFVQLMMTPQSFSMLAAELDQRASESASASAPADRGSPLASLRPTPLPSLLPAVSGPFFAPEGAWRKAGSKQSAGATTGTRTAPNDDDDETQQDGIGIPPALVEVDEHRCLRLSRTRSAAEWALAALHADLITPIGGHMWNVGLIGGSGSSVSEQRQAWTQMSQQWVAEALIRAISLRSASGFESRRGQQRWACDLPREFTRQGISALWHVTKANFDFSVCKTYPQFLCVPASISDAVLRNAAQTRSKNRCHALTYFHKSTSTAIVRCSQPLGGEQFFSCLYASAGTDMINAIRKSTTNGSIVVFDLRPFKNAVANVFGGGSYEGGSENIEVRFCNIENIHKVRAAFDALYQMIHPSHTSQQRNGSTSASASGSGMKLSYVPAALGLSSLQLLPTSTPTEVMQSVTASRWIEYSFSLISTAVEVARVVSGTNLNPGSVQPGEFPAAGAGRLPKVSSATSVASPVVGGAGTFPHTTNPQLRLARTAIVHCSDGWDRTSQVCALAQLMLDPYFRTIHGFVTLVEKDFVMFGHNFRSRADCHVLGLHGHVCPIFMLFLDAVYQLLVVYPSSFEFTEAFLHFLLGAMHGAFVGTFAHNSLQELLDAEAAAASTFSLFQLVAATMGWISSVEDCADDEPPSALNPWLNPSYTAEATALLDPISPVHATLWKNLITRHAGSAPILKPTPHALVGPASNGRHGNATPAETPVASFRTSPAVKVQSMDRVRAGTTSAMLPTPFVLGGNGGGGGGAYLRHPNFNSAPPTAAEDSPPSRERLADGPREDSGGVGSSTTSGSPELSVTRQAATPLHTQVSSLVFPSTPMQLRNVTLLRNDSAHGSLYRSGVPDVLSMDDLANRSSSRVTPSTPSASTSVGHAQQQPSAFHGHSASSSTAPHTAAYSAAPKHRPTQMSTLLNPPSSLQPPLASAAPALLDGLDDGWE